MLFIGRNHAGTLLDFEGSFNTGLNIRKTIGWQCRGGGMGEASVKVGRARHSVRAVVLCNCPARTE